MNKSSRNSPNEGYFRFWGISQPVFTGALTKADDFFVSPPLQKILERVTLKSTTPGTLSLISAPQGGGKSALALWLYQSLPYSKHECLLLSALSEIDQKGWLYRRIASHFDTRIEKGEISLRQTLDQALRRLDELNQEQRTLTVVIDSAENSDPSVIFQDIRTLLGLQSHGQSLVSFVLLSDEKFAENLPTLTLQAYSIHYKDNLPNLSLQDATAYLLHKIRISGLGSSPFHDEAIRIIHQESKGLPESLNHLAENCLVEAYLVKSHKVTPEIAVMVRESHRLMFNQNPQPPENHVRDHAPLISTPPVQSPNAENKPKKTPIHERGTSDSISLSSLFMDDVPPLGRTPRTGSN